MNEYRHKFINIDDCIRIVDELMNEKMNEYMKG